MIGGGALTFAPRSFLDHYSKIPVGSIASLLFATVLSSHSALVIQVEGGGHHVPTPVHQGSRSSCPDPVGVDLVFLLTCCYVMGGMTLSPIIRSHRMSVLPWHCMLTTIMGGSPVQLPLPPKISTTTIPTMAVLHIMGSTHPLNHPFQCMGGILLLFGMFLHLGMEVGQPFPRVMGGIPMWLHWLP